LLIKLLPDINYNGLLHISVYITTSLQIFITGNYIN